VNVASRVSGIGKAGQIIVGRTTLEALGGAFAFRRLAPVPVRGKREPLELFEVFAEEPRRVGRGAGAGG